MDTTFANLGADILPEEMRVALQEAFDKKVAEAREDAEMSIRAEFAERYNHDREALIEAMDRMLTDVVKDTEAKKAEELEKIKGVQERLEAAITETKANHKAKLKEHIARTSEFVTTQLAEKINALAEAKVACIKQKKKIDETFESMKAHMVAEQAQRLKKIDEFVVRTMSREIEELNEDRRALTEARVRIVRESEQKIKATQKRFVAEAAKKVDQVVTSTLKTEITALHEDLERNRQNMFGRRIFEAVAAEFMTSHLADGTEAAKVRSVLEAKEKEFSALENKLNEAKSDADKAARKVKIAEETAARVKVMSELLSNLRGDKRSLMESMLENTKTDNLRKAFDRLLPVVLNEGARKPTEKKVISENRAPVRLVTGDKPRLVESQTEAQAEFDAETASILRLAGLTR